MVNVRTRRKCQKCRYDICLSNGMDPYLVLTDDQITERFKNKLKYSDAFPTTSPEPSCSGSKVPRLGPVPLLIPNQPPPAASCIGSPSPRSAMKRKSSELAAPQIKAKMPSLIPIRRREPTSKTELRHINNTLQCFSAAICNQNVRLQDDFIQKIVWFQRGEQQLSKDDILAIISHLVITITTFAKSQALFQNLSADGQIRLCSRGASLYIQYVMARFFTSKNGREQLQWLLGIQTPVDALQGYSNYRVIKLEDINMVLPFINEFEDMQVYLSCIKNISDNYSFSIIYNGLVANLLMCSQTLPQQEVQPSLNQQQLFEEALSLLNKVSGTPLASKGSDVAHIRKFIESLTAMENIFSKCKLIDGNQASNTATTTTKHTLAKLHQDSMLHVPLGFTYSDWMFLSKQYRIFKEGYASVSANDFIIKVYHDNTFHGKSVPLGLMPMAIQMFLERFRALFHSIATEFGIAEVEQGMLWSRNCSLAVAFNILKMETAASGNQQFNYALGRLENENYVKERFGADFKFLNMRDVSAGRLSPEQLALYNMLVSNISNLVKDGMSFMLITMITMLYTSHNERSNYSHLKFAMQKQLIRMLQQHLTAMGCKSSFDEVRFSMVLNHIRGISEFVPKLLSRTPPKPLLELE